jgi:hypothetical protein
VITSTLSADVETDGLPQKYATLEPHHIRHTPSFFTVGKYDGIPERCQVQKPSTLLYPPLFFETETNRQKEPTLSTPSLLEASGHDCQREPRAFWTSGIRLGWTALPNVPITSNRNLDTANPPSIMLEALRNRKKDGLPQFCAQARALGDKRKCNFYC